MSTFDFLGLKKGLAPEPAQTGSAPPAPKGRALSPKAWVALAAADLVLAAACGAFLFMRLSAAPEPAVPSPVKTAAKPAPKPAEPVKPPEPAAKAEPSKTEPKKAQPAKAAPGPAKVPLGSPSVHATPPPKHQAAPKTATAAAAKPGPGPAKRSQTRPVPFSVSDSDAKEVSLMGPFLVRSGGRKAMFKDSKGVWTTTVYLVVGQTYKYRFEVSGPKGKKLTPYQKVEVLDGD